jgi:DNA polymerase/3'-5' exonuclease PolX
MSLTSANPKENIRYNEKNIDILNQLSNIMLKTGKNFIAKAYQNASETMQSHGIDIKSPNDLKDKKYIGTSIMNKLNEYFSNGSLKLIEIEKNNPINELLDVYGIGPKKANELVDIGITTISQLRENQNLLNDIQRVGLKYYEVILKRIPRDEIENYQSIFKSIFFAVSKSNKGISSYFENTCKTETTNLNSKLEIVGSFRRNCETSGDIDVIITSQTSQVFVDFIDELIKKNIIIHILSRGPIKSLVFEFPFAILYFTGSKKFNTGYNKIFNIYYNYIYKLHFYYIYISNEKSSSSKWVYIERTWFI